HHHDVARAHLLAVQPVGVTAISPVSGSRALKLPDLCLHSPSRWARLAMVSTSFLSVSSMERVLPVDVGAGRVVSALPVAGPCLVMTGSMRWVRRLAQEATLSDSCAAASSDLRSVISERE